MKSLYAIILITSVAIPFVLSFDHKLQFWKQWKFLFPAILIIAAVYIFFDVLLTKAGVWGFNPDYHLSVTWLNLPVEEWLFFVIIPYASIFLHDSIALYFPRFKTGPKTSKYLTYLLIVLLLPVILLSTGKTYTVYILTTVVFSLILSLADNKQIINQFYLTYLVILLPFLLVNTILTGSFISSPVVWYNDAENLGIRIFTIPIEDFGYAFSMILLNLLLREKIKSIASKS